MNFEWFVSLRYLFAKRRGAFLSLITVISIAGVAVGVTALIVVLAVMNGFQEDLRNRILGVTSHIVVGSFGGTVSNYREITPVLERVPGVVGATPFVYTQVMISSGKSVSGAVLRGIEILSASKVTRVGQNVALGRLADLKNPDGSDGAPAQPAIILGSELARNLAARAGDYITIVSPAGRLTPMGQIPKSKLFKVVGTFTSGLFEYDNTLAYVDIEVAQQFLSIGDTVTGIEVGVSDIYSAEEIAKSIEESLGSTYWVRNWMQMNQSLFAALKLEKAVMFVILTLIVLVAAFNIVSSLIMLVTEKGRDIAILKAMGATTTSIRRIFVIEGLLIGASGTLLGLGGGFGLCSILKKYKFIDLPPPIYHLSKLPVKMQTADVLLIALSAILISLIATIYPSQKAAKLDPADALRYE